MSDPGQSDPGQAPSIPPDPKRYSGYQHPPANRFGPLPPGQSAPKQPLATRLTSTLDSWQKVVLACTALIVAIGGLAAAVNASRSSLPGGGAPQAVSTASPATQAGPVSTPANQPSASTPAGAPPSFAFSIPTLTQGAGPAAACQQGKAAITTFNQTAGSTSLSEANAAERAVNGIEAAIQDAGYSGAIYSDLVIINNDFEYLYEAAMERDSSGISTLLSQINVDSRQLANDCNAG